jgi:hypothetical protein
MIYTRDHAPMHVHALRGNTSAKIEFESEITVIWNRGLSRRELRRSVDIITVNRDLFIQKWREIYG